MLKQCPKNFKHGQVCEKYSQLICQDHKQDTCPFCVGKLRATEVLLEDNGSIPFDWLFFEGSEQIGIFNANWLPSYLFSLWSTIHSSQSPIKIILFLLKASLLNLTKFFTINSSCSITSTGLFLKGSDIQFFAKAKGNLVTYY